MVRDDVVLSVNDLNCGYRKTSVLTVDKLDVYRGSIIIIEGGNGSGKTTFLKTLLGVIPPLGGSITVLGHNIQDHLRAVRRSVSYIAQHDGIFQRLSVENNIEFARATSWRGGDADEALGRFPVLKSRRSSLAGKLSGGEKKLLAVACALVRRPDLFLCDELSAGLEPKNRYRAIRELEDAVNRSQCAAIVTTHESSYFNQISSGKLLFLTITKEGKLNER